MSKSIITVLKHDHDEVGALLKQRHGLLGKSER